MIFQKWGGGGQRPFGTFPKIDQFWRRHPSLIFLSFHFQLKSVMEGSPFKCLESIFLWIKNWIKSLFFLAKFNHRMNCRIVPPRANTSWSCPRNGEIYVGAGQFGNFLHSIHVWNPYPEAATGSKNLLFASSWIRKLLIDTGGSRFCYGWMGIYTLQHLACYHHAQKIKNLFGKV